MTDAIQRRPLGNTGEMVSMIGLGGAHIGKQADERESIAIIRAALDAGINFLDNCWDYNEGLSEIRMGKALRDGYRERAFLMTKIDGRDRETAAQQIDESLSRLQTDYLDLLQLHEVIWASDPARTFGPGGAIEAMLEAKQAGKARFLGFTGHKSPYIHLAMLQAADEHGVRWDAVQMPLNLMDAHYDSFEQRVLPVLHEKQIAPLAMKPLGGRLILESGTATKAECLRYALSLPVSVVITGCVSLDQLEETLAIARTFQLLSAAEREALLAKTRAAAARGEHELYKTGTRFDGTARRPEWMGPSGVIV